MFYCDDCAEITNWPKPGIASFGRCEMCMRPGRYCNDVSSGQLTIPDRDMHVKIRALYGHEIQEEP